jgi:hypothetical protein
VSAWALVMFAVLAPEGGGEALELVLPTAPTAVADAGSAGLGLAGGAAGVLDGGVTRHGCTSEVAKRQAQLEITAVDVNGSPVEAEVWLGGALVGHTPLATYSGCATTVVVRLGALESSHPVTVSAHEGRQVVRAEFKVGTPNLWSVSVSGEVLFRPTSTVLPYDWSLPGVGRPRGLVGGGLQVDSWGSPMHLTLGVSASPVYAFLGLEPFRSMQGAFTRWFGRPLVAVPGLDVLIGYCLRPGNDTIRALLSLQGGITSLFNPTVRAEVGLVVLGRLLLTFSCDLRAIGAFVLQVPDQSLTWALVARGGVVW